MPEVQFNFTPEQQEQFNLIYHETKILHPHLVKDDIMKERTKILIAYTVINNDKPLNEASAEELNIFNEL